jgi:hypothetical protein
MSSVTNPVTIFLTIERYTNPVTMSGQDAALVEVLNGDATGRTLDLLRRLADTVASGRRLDATELAELNALLALVSRSKCRLPTAVSVITSSRCTPSAARAPSEMHASSPAPSALSSGARRTG